MIPKSGYEFKQKNESNAKRQPRPEDRYQPIPQNKDQYPHLRIADPLDKSLVEELEADQAGQHDSSQNERHIEALVRQAIEQQDHRIEDQGHVHIDALL